MPTEMVRGGSEVCSLVCMVSVTLAQTSNLPPGAGGTLPGGGGHPPGGGSRGGDQGLVPANKKRRLSKTMACDRLAWLIWAQRHRRWQFGVPSAGAVGRDPAMSVLGAQLP